jgi:hypothetical protein
MTPKQSIIRLESISNRALHSLQENRSLSSTDFVVFCLIIFLGALHFAYYPRASDFMNDAMYPDLARSLLYHRSYQFDFLPETTLPPGLPLILATVGWLAGFSPAISFHVIALCTTLGLIAAYELLRRVESRTLAAAACLLFGASPSLFRFDTQLIFSEMPYFLVSMIVLLLAFKINQTKANKVPVGWMVLLSIGVALAVLIRSVGIALLIGLCTCSLARFLVGPRTNRRRLGWFLIPLALGLTAQLTWMNWAHHHQTIEWQLPGWPQSYLAQIKVKNGNIPEMGTAHLSDLPGRIAENLVQRTVLVDQVLTGRSITQFWSSPAVFGVLVLVLIGLASSFRDGGHLHDWYFLWHEATYLLWPWSTEERFLYPVVPLACLYLWRGIKALNQYVKREPRTLGLCFTCLGTLLTVGSAEYAISIFRHTSFMVNRDHLQGMAAVVFWGALTVIGLEMFSARAFARGGELAIPFLRVAAVLVIGVIVCDGVIKEVHIGYDNMRSALAGTFSPDIEAAEWIQTHEPADRVVMARKQDLVFHYSHHRVVWFPPISNPKVLMDGIHRHHIGVVVVAHHASSYWLPSEEDCFQELSHAYGKTFHLVHHDQDDWVFEVNPSPIQVSMFPRAQLQ